MVPRRLLALAALLLAVAVPASASAADLLPDFDQEMPGGLVVTTDKTGPVPRFHLGFDSAVDNVGKGPLVVDPHRESTDQPQMTAEQVIHRSDGTTRTVSGVGVLQYVYSKDHNHWHYLGFDRYELRRASDYKLIAPDQKTGFCLGDRYNTHAGITLPNEPEHPTYTGFCGQGRTDLLALEEGISVGYGDVYHANLEGQFVDLTGVPAGEYYLVHRVNADRRLAESDYKNDASSSLVYLSWPNGTTAAPSVKVLRGCPLGETCPGPDQQPPALSRAAAVRYARTALRRTLGFTPQRLDVGCSRRTRTARTCTARGSRGRWRYSAGESIALTRSKLGIVSYSYSVRVNRTDSRCAAAGRARCVRALPGKRGSVTIGRAKAKTRSAAVAEPRQRPMALDDAPLDGVFLGAVVNEVPRLVRHPLGGGDGGVPAQ